MSKKSENNSCLILRSNSLRVDIWQIINVFWHYINQRFYKINSLYSRIESFFNNDL